MSKVSLQGYKWTEPQTSLQNPLQSILQNRGLQPDFLVPDYSICHSPWLLHDMQKAVIRIRQAIKNHEQITIYGDYDADGITSTSVMFSVIKMLGGKVNYYVPNRFRDGYGPNLDAYKRIVKSGTKLIITVDNGVSGKDVIDPIVDKYGVDVLITDHHELPDDLPTKACAIVHPRFPGFKPAYPFDDLSGVGVAFKVAQALLGEFPAQFLDLVAVGEIADVVKVTDENRYLIGQGLKILASGARPGFRYLLKMTGLEGRKLTSIDVGFTIAPRLNALGRISDASMGVKLLTSMDTDEVAKLVNKMERLNLQRKSLVADVLAKALPKAQRLVDAGHAVLLVSGKNWHPGVLGIVASNLLDKFNRPVIVVSQLDDDDVLKGSGRSLDGFDMYQGLDPHRDLMVSFGGHPGACGLSVEKGKLEELQDVLDQEAKKQGFDSDKVTKTIDVDTQLLRPLTVKDCQDVDKLSPFGPGNDEPVIEIHDIKISQVKTMGSDNSHLRIVTNQGINCVGFGLGKLAIKLNQGDIVDIAGTLNLNYWNGNVMPQVMIEDIRK